jgi:hypothetical protein
VRPENVSLVRLAAGTEVVTRGFEVASCNGIRCSAVRLEQFSAV